MVENKYIDESVNPGDDFFKYATGHWIDYNPQPAEYPRWGTFTALAEDNLKKVNKIITKPGKSELSKKINEYYKLNMDYTRRNADGVKPLLSYLHKNLYSLFTKEEIIQYCANTHKNIFFSLHIDSDLKNSDMNVVYVHQGGLTLGNKDYYLVKTKENKKILSAYKKYVIAYYMMLGKSKEVATEKFKTIFKIEKSIAKVSYSEEELYRVELNYHPKTVKALNKSLKFDFAQYLTDYGYDETTNVIVGQEKHLKFVAKLFNTLTEEELKTVVEWYIMRHAVNSLSDDVSKLSFMFNKVISGAKKPLSKKRKATGICNSIFGEVIGQIYSEQYFSPEDKENVIEMINAMVISYMNIIVEQSWMSEETIHAAIQKLKSLRVKVGYPDKIEDFSDIPVDSSLTLFENNSKISRYFWNKDKDLHYNKPVDKDEWLMNPQDVNAYYNPTTNEICFPAGILQGVFYSSNRSDAENYGAIGVIIGHEMTHGYDNNGRQFDKDGNMTMWWKPEEVDKFNELTKHTEEHFNALYVLPDLKCNGTLTLCENLADYGGLKIAYNAAMNTCNTYDVSWDKEFFISYATVWAGVCTEEQIRWETMNDTHSINYIRVNGTLPMFDPWYKAFDIKETDKLYVKPEDRAKIW